MIKPVAAGSSRGVTLVAEPAGLAVALAAALALDDRVLAEDVTSGGEIDLAVLGHDDLRVPASLSDADRAALETAAVTMFDALGCAGVARIDFFLTATGPVLNEINTMPGFTEHSQVPKMFAAAGLLYIDLLDLLVMNALTSRRVFGRHAGHAGYSE